jgi:hypothetical protein
LKNWTKEHGSGVPPNPSLYGIDNAANIISLILTITGSSAVFLGASFLIIFFIASAIKKRSYSTATSTKDTGAKSEPALSYPYQKSGASPLDLSPIHYKPQFAMVMTSYKCPECSGKLDIPESGKVLISQYCETPIKPVDVFEKVQALIQ